MKKHSKQMRETRVVPRAMMPLDNGEAAPCGTAMLAVNMREREQSLQVTGMPQAVGSIGDGERLLTMSEGHTVTCRGRIVMIDGVQVTVCGSEILGAHHIGGMIVIVGRGGVTYLARQGDQWIVLDPADAVPQLGFTANLASDHATLDAYTFAEPYSQWQAPLSADDTASLSAMLRVAWNALNADARASGRHTSPMLVRWAVRLHDGNYLWMSSPVRVGDETLANADRVAAMVEYDNNGFVGTMATALTLRHYSLDIAVTRGIAAQWLPLVAGIDILATDEAQLLNASRALDYRCLTRTTGPREYVLEMGLSRRSAAAISHQLAASPWRVIATAAASAAMSGSDFVPPVEALTLSAAQCGALAAPLQVVDVVCSTTAGGRLYCCTAGGDVVVSAPGNALIEAHRRSVMGTVPLAMAVATRPLYSSGFGRYPVYVFSDDGVYAIPQSAGGKLGEARLLDRTVIAPGVAPVEAGGDVWLMSRHGHLCRLSGSRLTVAVRDMDCRAMAWCNAYRELWLLPASGKPVVMMESGLMSRRGVDVAQLYSDARHAVAVAPGGEVLDLEQEAPAMMPVAWRTHPIPFHPLLGEALQRVVWHMSSEDVSLTLRVMGQRGITGSAVNMSAVNVRGEVTQPLATPTLALRARSLQLDVTGEARTGSLLLPTLVYSSIKR